MKKPKQLVTTFCEYSVSGVLGQGGSGIVYLATDQDGEEVAIKCLNPRVASQEKLKRFKNEFNFCSKADHPNLIKVIDHGITSDGEAFFVMPKFDSSLRPLIGQLEHSSAIQIFGKLLDGVEAAHKLNVIHRDLKPENVLIKDRGGKLVVADFGIARFEEEELLTAVETKDGARLANFQMLRRSKELATELRTDAQIFTLLASCSTKYSPATSRTARNFEKSPMSRTHTHTSIKSWIRCLRKIPCKDTTQLNQ